MYNTALFTFSSCLDALIILLLLVSLFSVITDHSLQVHYLLYITEAQDNLGRMDDMSLTCGLRRVVVVVVVRHYAVGAPRNLVQLNHRTQIFSH